MKLPSPSGPPRILKPTYELLGEVYLRAGKPKHIVTAASLFILLNSIFGIIGQLSKNTVLSEIQNYWYLLAAVLIGGQIGNFLNLKIFSTRALALVTAFLVLFVAVRMLIRFF